jgi:anti-anti-sigma factor
MTAQGDVPSIEQPGADRRPGATISPEAMRFSFSDTIAGYVTSYDPDNDIFELQTIDGRHFPALLTATTFAEITKNLDEEHKDATQQMRNMLVPDRFLFAYGIFYSEGDTDEFVFEEPGFWPAHLRALADFYLRAEFDGGEIDFDGYRTTLSLSGEKIGTRQEACTMSRLVYGFATAYHLTGEERFLTAAERGCAYLETHMRSETSGGEGIFWVHGVDIHDDERVKLLSSEFGDDDESIPLYEQIYALAGPAQTLRVTGNPALRELISATVDFIEHHYRDEQEGGYFSHIDPVCLEPRRETLGTNRARKNWNSIGDHAPAYLINSWLATLDERYRNMLVQIADTIVDKFPDDGSPFVNERFHADWTSDHQWGWQQNRAVVGHNLKIAWNLMRIHSLHDREAYVELAERLARQMPEIGLDHQRGGWYDVMERWRDEGQQHHRLVWHDRKAWWQQEQAILAYLILAGTRKDVEFRRLARESAAFYVTWFPDHDSGGVYFNVLANGLPYLMQEERLKGNHSMSGYHAFELAFLAAVYTNLLINGHPLDLYYRPCPADLPDGVLHVAPDLLPLGSIRIHDVWVDDKPYEEFDAEQLTVHLPQGDDPVRVRVRLTPSECTEHREFADTENGVATLTIEGKLDGETVGQFEIELHKELERQPWRVIIRAHALDRMTAAAARVLLHARQSQGGLQVYVVGASESVRQVCRTVDPSGEAIYLVGGEHEIEADRS